MVGQIRNLSPALWKLTHLTALYLDHNSLTRLPPSISLLQNLRRLDLSSNKLRSLPSEIGDCVKLQELMLNNNYMRQLPYELGKLFQLVVSALLLTSISNVSSQMKTRQSHIYVEALQLRMMRNTLLAIT